MEVKDALKQMNDIERKTYAYGVAWASLNLDANTVAPRDTSEGRGIVQSILGGERQKIMADPKVGEMLDFLSEHSDELSLKENREVEELKRQYDHMRRIPADEYMDYMKVLNEADYVWHRAKEENDFDMFEPVLEKIVDYNIKFAGYYDSSKKPYDALLDEYERGTNMEYLDKFFGTVREELVPLISAIGEKPQIDDSFLYRHYPADQQRRFSDYLMEVLGLDRNHCGIGETEHPFTLGFNNKDVRITTNYKEDNLASSMFSVIHEGGHAKYELGVCDDVQYTCLAGGASTAVHESQSRFYENIIGRSLPFIEYIFPKMQEFFPDQLSDVTAEQMYAAVNKVEPSLIRTEADEVTYPLHVMIRYEIEKMLISGDLKVKDIPEVWNQMYKEYLGVDVPDNKRGCLQDSHWSGGSIGYFPSYALGSAYAAQMYKNMQKDIDVQGTVRNGDLSGVNAWLHDKVHKYGCLLTPEQVIANSCGTFDPSCYTDYLKEKYTALYRL